MQTKSIGMGMLVIICNISIPATGCNKAGGSDSQAIVATYCKKKKVYLRLLAINCQIHPGYQKTRLILYI